MYKLTEDPTIGVRVFLGVAATWLCGHEGKLTEFFLRLRGHDVKFLNRHSQIVKAKFSHENFSEFDTNFHETFTILLFDYQKKWNVTPLLGHFGAERVETTFGCAN